MADKMLQNKKNIGKMLNFVTLQSVFYLLLVTDIAYTATTTPAATTPPATTVAPTTPPTTQAPTTTTTLPPTTTLAPNQDRTTIGETVIGQCLCDLTGNACDVKCCCDPDCTAEDVAAFKDSCDTVSVVVDNKVCYQEQVFLFTSSPARTSIEDGGLFCIYYDNYAERNFYLDPNFVQDPITFNNYVADYGNPSVYSKPSYTEPQFTFDSYYKYGDPVYVVYPNEARGEMVLPTPLVSNECVDQNSMAYLKEENTECVREVTSLATQCDSLPTLSYAAYALGFKVVMTPGLFGYVENGTLIEITTPAPPATSPGATTPGATDVTTAAATTTTPLPTTTLPPTGVVPGNVQTLYTNPYTLEIDYTTLTHQCIQADGSVTDCTGNIANTSYTAGTGTCNNVVREVHYRVTTNGIAGITQVLVQFVFDDITTADLPLTQKFMVNYNSVTDTTPTVSRSGNPGYQVGKILQYGTLNQTTDSQGVTTQQIVLLSDPDPTLGLTVISSSVQLSLQTGAPTMACSLNTATRIPLRFGEDVRTGCTIQLNLTSLSGQTNSELCADIQTSILQALEGPNLPTFDTQRNAWPDANRYVATFGNTGTDQVGDWVKVIVNNRPIPNRLEALPKDTCRLSLGLHIQVLYASVGALANPQSKILGVALLYDNVRDVKFRCVGGFCQDVNQDLIQSFEVSQSVSYVDASQPAIKYKGEAPIFIARVPNDFFYPFLFYTSSASKITQCRIIVILSMLVTSCFNLKSSLV